MTPEEYRNEGYRIYEEDMDKAVELFQKAAAKKDIPAGVALAAYYYDEECDENSAKEWLEKAFEWFEQAGNPEEFADYVAFGHYEMGMILYQCELDCAGAWLEFTKAVDAGYAEAYASMGTMLYEGDWTPDGDPDVNGAVELWETGMSLGDQKCTGLYKEHKGETVKDPKTVRFENGDVYKGDVNAEGKPHGNGHMDYNENGYWAEYDGAWVDGKRQGYGHYHSMSKAARRYAHDYKGEWLDDKQHGQGTSEDSSEVGIHCSTVTETYTGGFKEGKRHGHGVLVKDHFDGSFTNGKDRVEGEWVDGNLTGSAIKEYANGDCYEGPVTGHGKYTFASGLSFEGEWDGGRLVPESIKVDAALKSPLMLVTEHHSGFDYNNTGTFLFPAEKTFVRYGSAVAIERDSTFSTNQGIEITEVTADSVSFKVRGAFVADGKSFTDTLRRSESQRYEDSHRATATIYDDDYDYTVNDYLEVKVL